MEELDKDNSSLNHFINASMKKSHNDSGGMELDPRVVKAGFDLTGYYVETGLKSFSDYAQKMIEEYGHDVMPYLRSWYLSVRYYPGIDPTGMDSAAQVDEFMTSCNGFN